MLVKSWVAALREKVACGPRDFHSVWADCPRFFASWAAVLSDAYACGLCTLTSLRLVGLENAEIDVDLALERCVLS